MKTARITILMFVGLVALGIWQAVFQEGLSWAAWLDTWSFSLLTMLLIIGVFIGFGASLYAVISRLWSREESNDRKTQKAA